MIKQVQFFGKDEAGQVFCQPLLDDGLIKTASASARSNLHPQIADFVRVVRPSKHGIYVLVNALGAGEIWGSNINGDHFPERELIHAPSDWEKLPVYRMKEVGKKWEYGFPTFMGAHPYKHHQNKDSSRAFGSVEIAVWNPKMRRVELVVYLDRELCKRFDAYDIIERIERGEFPDVSMGCKVPFDVCSICQHRSKTPKDYCEHAKQMMNKIFPDGRKVFVYNPRPRFFDISFVFIGADKTAKVMAKLASRGAQVCLGEFCVVPRLSADVGEMFSKEAFDLSRATERLRLRRTDPRTMSPEDKAAYEEMVAEERGEKLASDAAQEREPTPPGRVENIPDSQELYAGGMYHSPTNDFTRGKTREQVIRETHAAAPAFNEKLFPPAQLDVNDSYNGQESNQLKVASVKTANDPVKKFIHIQGIPIMLEWLKGETRKYSSGFSQKMKADYGYIPGTMDSDGEQLDVYIGPKKDSELVFIINQLKDDGSHDERKVMLAYQDEESARESYLAHMPKKRLGRISRTTISVFKKNHLPQARAARSTVAEQPMQKLAGGSCGCHGLGDDCGGSAEKVAHAVFPGTENTEKSASHRKLSEIIKSIPAGPFSKETLPKLERGERDIPKDTLNRMGEMDLGRALSTPAMMGIVLKPREFQRVMLVRIGERSMADELDRKGEVFGPSSEVDDSLDVSPDRIHHLLKELLQAMGLFRDRSAARHQLAARSKVEPKTEKTAQVSSKEPILRKLAAAYNGYRRNIVKKAAAIEQYLVSDPQLAPDVFGGSMAQAFAGGIGKTASTSVFSPDSLAYLTGAYHKDRDLHVADKGVVASLAQMGALTEAMSQ
jgi:inorganic pyrophosphatase